MRRYGRVYQAGTQQRSEYDGKFRMACEFVRSGRIGKLQAIYAYRDGGGIFWPKRFGAGKPVPEDLDWDLYLGPVPWFPYDGKTGSHRFDIGELNWGQHHYDIVQWAADADETGPVEIFMDGARSGYKYASGVTVYGKPYPGEPVGGDGGACFVGSAGRIAVDRDALVSDPPDLVRNHSGPMKCISTATAAIPTISWSACARVKRPSATPTSRIGRQRVVAGRGGQTVAAHPQMGPAGRAVSQRRGGQPFSLDSQAPAVARVSPKPKARKMKRVSIMHTVAKRFFQEQGT